MELIAGIVLVLLSLGAFVYSLPRHGKTARFVGTEWEGYVVVMMIGVLGDRCRACDPPRDGGAADGIAAVCCYRCVFLLGFWGSKINDALNERERAVQQISK